MTKPELVDPTPVSAPGPSAAATEQQMLGAIIAVKDKGWFFKLVADPSSVEPVREPFLAFVKSITFSDGAEAKPSWKLPEGWSELPGSEFRYATVRLPQTSATGKPLEITVSSAGGDVLANINRWRGQVGLGPIAADQLATTAETFKVGGYDCTFVSLIGKGSGGMSSAPMAPFASGGATKRAAGDKRPTSDNLVYIAPPEWSAGTPNQFSLAAFSVATGDQKATITITSAGGDLLSNVNRWRGQLKLAPIRAEELTSAAKKIETLGVHGDYFELIGPEEAAPRQSILGVVAVAGGQTWFVKLVGDHELVLREKPRFEAFVKSLKMK